LPDGIVEYHMPLSRRAIRPLDVAHTEAVRFGSLGSAPLIAGHWVPAAHKFNMD